MKKHVKNVMQPKMICINFNNNWKKLKLITSIFCDLINDKPVLSAFSALSRKWKEKSDLITELDNKIRRASETYQTNEKKLLDENTRLIENQKYKELIYLK